MKELINLTNLSYPVRVGQLYPNDDYYVEEGLLRSGMMKGPLKAGSMMERQALWIERMI